MLIALFAVHALRVAEPLLDVRLFRSPSFSAAAVTTFVLGAALFGAMVIMPLYFQLVRGEDAVTTGLLLIPQGMGAALAMPLAGRLTDRVGGGRVALVGLARSLRRRRCRSSCSARRPPTADRRGDVVRGSASGCR